MKTPRLDKEINNLQCMKVDLSPTGLETLNEYLAIKKALQPLEQKEVKCEHEYFSGTGYNVCKKCGDTY